MADSAIEIELRALTPSQLNTRIALVSAKKSSPTTLEDEKQRLTMELALAKSILREKQVLRSTLAAAPSKSVLSKIFFDMSSQELMEAYDYYAGVQRNVFLEYTKAVDYVKGDLSYNYFANEHEMGKVGALETELEEQGLPAPVTVLDIVQAEEKIPFREVVVKGANSARETTLSDVVDVFKQVNEIDVF